MLVQDAWSGVVPLLRELATSKAYSGTPMSIDSFHEPSFWCFQIVT